MAISSIIEKYGTCIDCVAQGDMSFKPIISDRCKAFHYNKYRREISAKKQQARQQAQRVKYLPANKKILEEKGIVKSTDLQLFYKVKMELNEPRCAECGAYKPELKQWEKGWHSCQAHLLPKEFFKSIQSNPLNCLVLGTGFSGLCFCHDIYDSNWEKASKMNIWPEVIRRIKILYPFILDKEKEHIPAVVWKSIPDEYKKYYGHNFVESIHLLP